MKKNNICFHIGNISNCGGTENVTTQIADMLLTNYGNYNVFILSSYYDIDKGPFFKSNKLIIYERLFNKETSFKKSYFKVIKSIKEFILKNDIDILIGVDTILSLVDIPAIRKTKCKYIAWEHFNYNYNLGVKLRDYGRKYASKKADALVVLTDKDKQYFKNNLKFKNCKLTRIYNPFFENVDNCKYNAKSNIIMSSGRLTYQKGFDLLLEIAKKLKEKTTDFKWIILGDGEDRNKLEKLINDYKLTNLVELKGRVKNISDYYQMSKMFVLTSRFEGFGLVIAEAKSYDLPIISFNCDCGPDELVKNNINGYLIDDFNIDEMGNKIYELLNNNTKCEEFSQNSNMDMEKFEPKTIIKEWDNLFKEVLK